MGPRVFQGFSYSQLADRSQTHVYPMSAPNALLALYDEKECS